MPRALLPSPPSSSLHLFPFSLPLRSILVWYCLSIAYKYPRVWPHQGQAIAAHLFSRLCALEGNCAPFSLSLSHSACVPCDSRSTGESVALSFPRTYSIVCSWIIWNMTLVLVYFTSFFTLPYSNLHVDSMSVLQKGWGVRDWGPHNASVKSCGKNLRWTRGVPIR